jgi:sulfite reductase alpha subunit-like flavoprotein
LPEFDLAVFVLSSTGEGEPPDNARSFWRFLVRKTHPKDLMARLKFTILGSASFPLPCALLALRQRHRAHRW